MTAIRLDRDATIEALTLQAGKETATYYDAPRDSSWRKRLAIGVTALVMGSLALGAVSQTYNTDNVAGKGSITLLESTLNDSMRATSISDMNFAVENLKDARALLKSDLQKIGKIEITGDYDTDRANLEMLSDTAIGMSKTLIANAKEMDKSINAANTYLERLNERIETSPIGKNSDSLFSFNSEKDVVQFGTAQQLAESLQEQINQMQAERDVLGGEIGMLRQYGEGIAQLTHSMDADSTSSLMRMLEVDKGLNVLQGVNDNQALEDYEVGSSMMETFGLNQAKELQSRVAQGDYQAYQQSQGLSFLRQAM